MNDTIKANARALCVIFGVAATLLLFMDWSSRWVFFAFAALLLCSAASGFIGWYTTTVAWSPGPCENKPKPPQPIVAMEPIVPIEPIDIAERATEEIDDLAKRIAANRERLKVMEQRRTELETEITDLKSQTDHWFRIKKAANEKIPGPDLSGVVADNPVDSGVAKDTTKPATAKPKPKTE